VIDAHGYVKIKDRSKDIIISGGENISTLEVEDVLYAILMFWRRRWWQSRTKMGRDAVRLCHAEDRRARGHRAGDHRLLPRSVGPFQMSARGGIRSVAEDSTQDPENVLREQAKTA